MEHTWAALSVYSCRRRLTRRLRRLARAHYGAGLCRKAWCEWRRLSARDFRVSSPDPVHCAPQPMRVASRCSYGSANICIWLWAQVRVLHARATTTRFHGLLVGWRAVAAARHRVRKLLSYRRTVVVTRAFAAWLEVHALRQHRQQLVVKYVRLKHSQRTKSTVLARWHEVASRRVRLRLLGEAVERRSVVGAARHSLQRWQRAMVTAGFVRLTR